MLYSFVGKLCQAVINERRILCQLIIGSIFTLWKIFFFYEMVLIAKAMYFLENMTRSELFFFSSCSSILYKPHTILNVDFVNTNAYCPVVHVSYWGNTDVHVLWDSCQLLQCSTSEMLEVSLVCLIRRNDLFVLLFFWHSKNCHWICKPCIKFETDFVKRAHMSLFWYKVKTRNVFWGALTYLI